MYGGAYLHFHTVDFPCSSLIVSFRRTVVAMPIDTMFGNPNVAVKQTLYLQRVNRKNMQYVNTKDFITKYLSLYTLTCLDH